VAPKAQDDQIYDDLGGRRTHTTHHAHTFRQIGFRVRNSKPCTSWRGSLRLGHGLDDVGVSGVGDGHARHAVVAAARSTKVDVV